MLVARSLPGPRGLCTYIGGVVCVVLVCLPMAWSAHWTAWSCPWAAGGLSGLPMGRPMPKYGLLYSTQCTETGIARL